jgi:hypothetical protein
MVITLPPIIGYTKIIEKPELQVWQSHVGRMGAGLYKYVVKGTNEAVNAWTGQVKEEYPQAGYGTYFDHIESSNGIVVMQGERYGSCD